MWLKHLVVFCLFLSCVATVEAEEVTAQLYTYRPLHRLSERFLSLTTDTHQLLKALPMEEHSFNMLRALSPMFLRLGGPSTNSMLFRGSEKGNWTMSEDDWMVLNDLATSVGADLIMSLNPTHRIGAAWDSKNSLELISFSEGQPYEIGWQLGSSLQSIKGVSGTELGRDSVRLRMILDSFPFYSKAPVLAPDMRVSYDQATLIRDYLSEAGSSISALPIQMTPAKEKDEIILQTGGMSQGEIDQAIWGRRSGKPVNRRPIWIAETGNSSRAMSDAMALIMRLGAAARAGYQVVLRQMDDSYLSAPTPDFWVSLLFKTLVGREVFDARADRSSKMFQVFSHCTEPTSAESALDSVWDYEKGALTIYGVNRGVDTVKLNIRPSHVDEPMHIYSITADETSTESPMPAFLNGQLLSLSPNGEVPYLSPRVRKASRNLQVSIAPRSVFFVVLPLSQQRTCINPNAPNPLDLTDIVRRLNLKTFDPIQPEKGKVIVDYEDDDATYVTFNKRRPVEYKLKPKTPTGVKISPRVQQFLKIRATKNQDSEAIKYVMNEEGWFNKFAESVTHSLPLIEKAAVNSGDLPVDLQKRFDFLSAAIHGLKNLTQAAITTREKRDVNVADIFKMGPKMREDRIRRRKRSLIFPQYQSSEATPAATVPSPSSLPPSTNEVLETTEEATEVPEYSTTIRTPPPFFNGHALSVPNSKELLGLLGFDSSLRGLQLPEMPSLGSVSEHEVRQRLESIRDSIREQQEQLLTLLTPPALPELPKTREEWAEVIKNSPLFSRLRRFVPEDSFFDESITSDDVNKALSKTVDPLNPFMSYSVDFPYDEELEHHLWPIHFAPQEPPLINENNDFPLFKRKRSVDNSQFRDDEENYDWLKHVYRIGQPALPEITSVPDTNGQPFLLSTIAEGIGQLFGAACDLFSFRP